METILITGATGLLGSELVPKLRSKHDLHLLIRRLDMSRTDDYFDKKLNIHVLDLEKASPDDVHKLIRDIYPDKVIHLASMTDLAQCETEIEKAYKINYLATYYIAESCRRLGIYMLYVSTDYVFDGYRGNYRENDVPRPLNYYGLTKLLGEEAIKHCLETHLIVRTSTLYGWKGRGKPSIIDIMIRNLKCGLPVEVDPRFIRTPTYVKWLADAISRLVEKEVTGTLHLAGPRIKLIDLAYRIAKLLGRNEDLVRPVEKKYIAKRPIDSSLDTTRARELGLIHGEHEKYIMEIAREVICPVSID